MKDFIEFLVKQIVTDQNAVEVDEFVEDNVSKLTICVDKDDMGILIGKEGKTIRSIRALAKAKAIRDQIKVYVDVC